MWLSFPFWFFSLIICNRSLLSPNKHSISYPADTSRKSSNFSIIKRNIDSFISDKSKIIQTYDNLLSSFDSSGSNSLDNRRAMIYKLFFTIAIITEEITATDHKNEIILYKQFHSILKLKPKYLIVIEKIKAAELISSEQKYLTFIKRVNG